MELQQREGKNEKDVGTIIRNIPRHKAYLLTLDLQVSGSYVKGQDILLAKNSTKVWMCEKNILFERQNIIFTKEE